MIWQYNTLLSLEIEVINFALRFFLLKYCCSLLSYRRFLELLFIGTLIITFGCCITMADDGENVPEVLQCNEQIFDICFHPNSDFLACGLVDGAVELYKYGLGENANQLVMNCNLSEPGTSCRGVLFSSDGSLLYTIGSDRALRVINSSGQQSLVFNEAHSDCINKLLQLSDHILATGDDSGEVKVWDTRTSQGEIMSWRCHEDFVSAFAYSEDKSTLLSAAGDATLVAYDMRKQTNTSRSDDQEAELQSLAIIKNGKKVVAGTQDGVILIFSWGRWGDCSDRYPGHPESVDCILKLDESTLLTGSSDGLIRCVALQPNKMIGVIGDHEEFPVESMTMDYSRRVLGSIAHDNLVRFWDISMFLDDEDDAMAGDEEGDEEVEVEGEGEEDEEGVEEECDEAVEMEDEDSTPFNSGSESDSDSDDEPAAGGGRPQHTLKTPNEKFYQDL